MWIYMCGSECCFCVSMIIIYYDDIKGLGVKYVKFYS